MAINFEKKTPDWENVGAEPDAELKKGGFRAGYKPPAAYFNWFFNRISASVKELQEKLAANLKALAFKDKVGNGDITDVAAGKVTQDSTRRLITDVERIAWNDKVDSAGGDIADTKVSAFEASTASFPVPAAGEKPRTLWGKMKKFTEDVKNWMTGVCLIGQIVNNCVTNRSDMPLSAAQGKALMDLITQLNSDVARLNIDKAAASHTHDDRYFTEWEINEKLKGNYCYTYNWNSFETKSYSMPITGLLIADLSVLSSTLANTTNGYVRIRIEIRRGGTWINGTAYDVFSGNSHYYDGAAVSLVCMVNAGDTLIATIDTNTSAQNIESKLHFKIF